jgi:hypothetical protein
MGFAKNMLIAASAVTMTVAPTVANAANASKLSVARASATADKGEKLAGGGLIVALLAAAAVVAGVVVVADSDSDSDSN